MNLDPITNKVFYAKHFTTIKKVEKSVHIHVKSEIHTQFNAIWLVSDELANLTSDAVHKMNIDPIKRYVRTERAVLLSTIKWSLLQDTVRKQINARTAILMQMLSRIISVVLDES
jgi:hypothetical protein